MRILLLVLLIVACLDNAVLSAQSRDVEGVKRTAARFYQAYMRFKPSGLPDARAVRVIAPMLTPELRRLFEGARSEQRAFMKLHPEEKPPWIEGDLFTSSWEGADSFEIGTPRVEGNRAEVPVHLTSMGTDPPLRWTDQLVLSRTRSGWRIDDIRLNGEWDFKSGSTLRGILSQKGEE